MITISRRLARAFRNVSRRALNLTPGCDAPPVQIETRQGELRLRIHADDAAIEYREKRADDFQPENGLVPYELFAECEKGKDAPVEIQFDGGGVSAHWLDGQVPATRRYKAVDASISRGKRFPGSPRRFAANPRRLLVALTTATATTDQHPSRYTLNCFQLRGSTGRLAATDGHQLFVESGFDFPWDGDLLVPGGKVFASKELAGDDVRIGKTGGWVVIGCGPWKIWLALEKHGRFPNIDDHVPSPDESGCSVDISDEDAEFLTSAVCNLPGRNDDHLPITLDLNGEVVVRAQGADLPGITELVLNDSRHTGEPVRISTNRTYLARAIKLGFRRVFVRGADVPLCCQRGEQSYVWASLSAEDCIPPTQTAERVESRSEAITTEPSSTNTNTRRTDNMPRTTQATRNESPTQPSRNGTPQTGEAATPATSALEHAAALRETLRAAAKQAGELVNAIKAERRQTQKVRSTLASLRQLQAIDA